MNFINGAQLLEYCEKENKKISEAMFERETTHLEADPERTMERMRKAYSIMKGSVKKPMEEDIISMGGMIGGESKKLHTLRNEGKNLCGSLVSKAIAYAMGVLEVNASMGLIVAAPTAGSSGVIPGTILSICEDYGLSEDAIYEGILNASAVGYIIMRNASVSGAEAGCQAEVGAASAMAASAAAQLLGGSPQDCLQAASLALSNLLGLVCDPIAGLVESPCQSRNAIGVSNAFTSAQLALAGVKHPIPFDEMVDAMYKVGLSLPFELRETALGGCAGTPTGCSLCSSCIH